MIIGTRVEIRDFSVAGHFCKDLLVFFLRKTAGVPRLAKTGIATFYFTAWPF